MTENTFDGKVALVTGSANGIGAATVQRLLEHGATVWATDLRGDLVSERFAQESGAHPTALDVTDSSTVNALLGRIADESGRLDVVVNSAGVPAHPRHGLTAGAELSEVTDDDLDFVLRVNLVGTFNVMRAAVALIRNNGAAGGAIVNVSSVGALMPVAIHAPYAASKAGVLGLTRATASHYAADNIRINAVAPGSVDTNMFPTEPVLRQTVIDFAPLKRLASAEELAATIVYLASEDASFITGQTISPNGGCYM